MWDADDYVMLLVVLGWVVLPLFYSAWATLSQHPFVWGAAAFLEGLWLIVVLLWLSAWDLGAWLGGTPPVSNPIENLPILDWLVRLLPARVRARVKRFLDDTLPLAGLIIGVLVGHAFWH
jgi:hypothetical protein